MSKRLSYIYAYLFAAWFLFQPLAAFSGRDVEKILREQGARAKANANLYYDEVFDQNGELRPQYKDIYPKLLEKSNTALKQARRLTKKDFRGDNALSPFALITDEQEHDLKRRGVDQRARALRAFLQDHYSGRKSYAEIIHPETVDKIIARTGESGYAGHINPDLITFMYGPDIIRGHDGQFYVLEDNTNYLGGQGDLVEARKSLWKRVPEYTQALKNESLADPMDFYRALLARYRVRLKNPKDKIVFFAVPPYPDNEDKRLIKIWKSLGVDLVTPFTRDPKLVKRADGMYLARQAGKHIHYEKVGFMILNTEFGGLDATFRPAHEQFLFETGKYFLSATGKDKIPAAERAALRRVMEPNRKTGMIDFDKVEKVLRNKLWLGYFTEGSVPGLMEAIVKGQVLANNTPGVDFINDKEFTTYVDDLIRHYLGEEPILKGLPTKRLYKVKRDGSRSLNSEVFQDLAEHQNEYVMKVVDGRGGDGVAVGPKETPEKWRSLLKARRRDTSREVIGQKYMHPSVVNGDIVDERILAQVGPAVNGKYVEVSPTGWSRGVSMEGDGKVNLSQGKAHELVVFERDVEKLGLSTRKPALDCPALYRRTLSPR